MFNFDDFDGHAYLWKIKHEHLSGWGRCHLNKNCFVNCSGNIHDLGSLAITNSTDCFSQAFPKHKIFPLLRSTNYELALLIGNCLEKVNIITDPSTNTTYCRQCTFCYIQRVAMNKTSMLAVSSTPKRTPGSTESILSLHLLKRPKLSVSVLSVVVQLYYHVDCFTRNY